MTIPKKVTAVFFSNGEVGIYFDDRLAVDGQRTQLSTKDVLAAMDIEYEAYNAIAQPTPIKLSSVATASAPVKRRKQSTSA